MSSDRIRVAVILASVRKGRFGPTIANWFAGTAGQRDDVEVDLVDLADFPLPTALTDEPAPEVAALLGAFSARLSRADGFVIVTPEYNHSFPASLKAALDFTQHEWHAKPVGFVGYGGLAGGLRAVQQLRHIVNELHAVPVRDAVSFHGPWSQFDSEGRLIDPSAAETAAKVLWDKLTWWALATREAKALRPYDN
ncbi:NADPH-dependent FMN reductase [Streptomyces tagetis]|uniref:NAD(P)H-dependent oxidoreductase n=1 Tax=Streptomyces tagetis TaxID=2820809 RepID=A0A940XBD7_9ACTN|nr:NAD(P)H-dependent oxidoreductase [Streptomyces sp. RG38]MBQ0827193.1 NAD(P)H-dependent oxidoreductase [Streptomyces sp. RG38]